MTCTRRRRPSAPGFTAAARDNSPAERRRVRPAQLDSTGLSSATADSPAGRHRESLPGPSGAAAPARIGPEAVRRRPAGQRAEQVPTGRAGPTGTGGRHGGPRGLAGIDHYCLLELGLLRMTNSEH